MDESEEIKKLRVLLPHWIEHNGEHADQFRQWAERAGPARDALMAAAEAMREVNAHLEDAMGQLGGPLEHPHAHPHHHD